MRLLLDSHVALWWLEANPSLGASCTVAIGDAAEVFYSAVTPWELGIKRALGRLTMPDDLIGALDECGFRELAISARHAERAAALPPHHRDPFDRLLVAQAQSESLVLVTADAAIQPYDVETLPATT